MAATILIADDDAVQRRLVENMVQRSGYQTVTFDSGDAAIAYLTAPDSDGADAMILDLGLPDGDGLALLCRLRSGGDQTPILGLTARDAIEDRESHASVAAPPVSGSITTKTAGIPANKGASRSSFQVPAPGRPSAGNSCSHRVWQSLSPSTMMTYPTFLAVLANQAP